MKKSSGFTLIELAIVLVIIGLLLGGVLKGQELINSAKAKNLAADFKNVQMYLYGYQDRFHALPGDDAMADVHLAGATKATTGAGNGIINGNWDAGDVGAESILFWQHVRLAGFASGTTIIGADAAAFVPRNAEGGRIGMQSIAGATNLPTPAMNGSFAVCSANITGKFAKQIDMALDDGETSTGSVRAYMAASEGAGATWVGSTGEGGISDAVAYNVCMSF